MGGQVRVVFKHKSKVTSFVAFTNSITRILKSDEFLNGDVSEIYESIEYFKKMKADYLENKDTGNYSDCNAPFYGVYNDEINPVQYGIILIDFDDKKISSCQNYSNFSTLHSTFGLYRNGVLILTNTSLDSRMKNKSISHFEIYEAETESFKKFEINEKSSTLIDLIEQVKQNVNLENLDYTEILGIAANVSFNVYLKTPYLISKFKKVNEMIDELNKSGIKLSDKEIQAFKEFGEKNE